MNQNLTYTYTSDPRNQQQNQQMRDHLQGLAFHPSSYQTSTYTTTTPSFQHQANNAAFLQSNVLQSVQQQQQNRSQPPQTIRLTQETEDKRIASMMETYFIEPNASTSSTWNSAVSHAQNVTSQLQPQISYTNGTLVATTGNSKPTGKMGVSTISPDKSEKERLKKARQAEAARMRYHRLTPEEKRELNLKRTLAQKRKRQREKELEELDSILRETNDIQEDPDITEQLREKRMRAKWAEAARARYARMTPDERRAHNNRRRMRQMQNALAAVKASSDYAGLQAVSSGDPMKDEEAVRQHIKNQNAKKAEAARQRYHRMTEEEKRMYNQRRTEAFRRRRMEEEMLLAMPIGRINGEALDRAQQIVVRNAKRAEAARARYQRMTPDQRKSYNQKRYTPKRRAGDHRMQGEVLGGNLAMVNPKKEELDALSSLERDVMKRTQQAQQALMRQGGRAGQSGGGTPGPSGSAGTATNTGGGSTASNSGGTYLIQQTPTQTVTHLAPQQVVHVTHQMPQQGGLLNQQQQQQQQQQSFQGLPTSQSGHQIVVHHQAPTHQVTYTSNGASMMMNGQQLQQQQQQVINPYGAPQQRN